MPNRLRRKSKQNLTTAEETSAAVNSLEYAFQGLAAQQERERIESARATALQERQVLLQMHPEAWPSTFQEPMVANIGGVVVGRYGNGSNV